MTRKILSPEQERSLVRDYVEDEWRIKDLTIIYRVSTRTVYRTLADYGIKSRANRFRLRKVERKRSKPRVLQPCGTNAAYIRHKRNGEYPCLACTDAHNAEQAKWRAKNRKKRKR